MGITNLGRDDKHFQNLMGAGGMTMSAPRPVKNVSQNQEEASSHQDEKAEPSTSIGNALKALNLNCRRDT